MRVRDRLLVTGLVVALAAPAVALLLLASGPIGPDASPLLLLPLVGKFVAKAVKGVVGGVSKGVRGLGRIARGKFKQGIGDIGGAAKGLAPLIGLIPGVGLPLAAAIGGGGGLLSGGGLKGALSGALGGAAGKLGGGLLSKLGGAGGLLGKIGGIGKSLGGGLGDALKFAQGAMSPGAGTAGAGGGGGGGLQGLLGTLLQGGGAALAGIEGAKARGRSRAGLEAFSGLGTDAAKVLRERLAAGPGTLPDPLARRLKRKPRPLVSPPPANLLAGGA